MNELEQAVIKAAREYVSKPTREGNFRRLRDALDSLDEPLKPDPWQILQDLYREFGFSISIDHSTPTGPELLDRVMKALEWRRNNGE